jgi:hypothetical protein
VALLRALADDLWVATHKLRFLGTPVVTRMTMIRLSGGGLVVIGAIPRSPALDEEVAALGPVQFVIAPNKFHHLYAGPWATHPGARLYGPVGLERKRKDLHLDGHLGPAAPDGWAGEIDQEPLGGLALMGDVVFLHRASRTLVLTDMMFNYPPTTSALTRMLRWLEDIDGKFVMPRLFRTLVRDRRAFAASVERILSWDFDRVIVAHGSIIESGGHERFRAALGKFHTRSEA